MNTFKHYFVLFLFVVFTLFVYQPAALFITDVKKGEISNKNIIAHKTITYKDELATEELLRQELEKIDNVYKKDPEVFEALKEKVEQFHLSVVTYKENQREYKAKIEEELKMKNEGTEIKKGKGVDETFEKIEISDLVNPFGLEYETLEEITEISETNLNSFFSYILNELEKTYDVGVQEDQVKRTRDILRADSNLFLFPDVLRVDLYNNILLSLEENKSIDIIETEKNKIEVEENVEPVYKKISKGEAVVRKYEEITDEHIHKLKELGLLDREIDYKEILTTLPLVLLVSLIFHFYCNKYLREDMQQIRTYSVTLGLLFIVIAVSELLIGSDWSLIPILVMLIILTMFWPRSFVLVVTVLLGLLISNGEIITLITILIAGLFSTILHKKFKGFTDSLKNGLILGFVVALSVVSLNLMFVQRFDHMLLTPLFYLIFSGIFAGIIATGTIPFIEKALGKVTVYRLTELNTLEHPLLVDLYERAQGTFDHSRNVADLATVASQRIGTDTLLLRVAALYHDIGKIKNPDHFIENSTPEENINDRLHPREAAKVILNHPIDSVKICKNEGFPKEVIQIIERHHGDSLLGHFYNRSLKIDPESREEDFRYTTPPPRSKEETILMLADVTEAYSRVLEGLDYDETRRKLGELIDKKIAAGDLRKSQLTIEEVTICLDEFARSLTASRHQRVKYDE